MFGKRIMRLTAFLLCCFFILAGRMYYLQVVNGADYAKSAKAQTTKSLPVAQFERGNFYDRYDRNLTGFTSPACVIFPMEIEDIDLVARLLAGSLNISTEQISGKIKKNAATAKPFMLDIYLNDEQVKEIEAFKLPGVHVLPMEMRYDKANLAAHVLGFVAEGSGGVLEGKSGLEQQYNSYLADRKSDQIGVVVDSLGRKVSADMRHFAAAKEDAGNKVKLTIDRDFQRAAEQALAGKEGAAVVMEVDTGRVLALASSPGYDQIKGQISGVGDLYVNKALSYYPPASLFKIVLASAAFDLGMEAPKDFVCTGSIALSNGRVVGCWNEKGHGEEDIYKALANSCNPYFIQLGQLLGGEVIKHYSALFGLTSQQLLGYKLPSNREANISFNSRVEGDLANASIGEGGILVTPLQQAQMFAIVGNGGIFVTPKLVEGVENYRGGSLIAIPDIVGEQVISEAAANKVLEALTLAAKEGTAKPGVPAGIEIAAKTGTSQDKGVWFGGLVPADNPQISVVVYLVNGVSGGKDAGKIFSEIVDTVHGFMFVD